MFDALYKLCPAARASEPWDRTPHKINFREEEVRMKDEMSTMTIDMNTFEMTMEEEGEEDVEDEEMEVDEQNVTIMNDED